MYILKDKNVYVYARVCIIDIIERNLFRLFQKTLNTLILKGLYDGTNYL